MHVILWVMSSEQTLGVFIRVQNAKYKLKSSPQKNPLTNSNSSNHWRHNDRQSHATGYDKVPLVLGDVFPFITIMNLNQTDSKNE